MARQGIEEMLERRVTMLKQEEKAKNEELILIQKELRRYETALESLRKEALPRKRRSKAVMELSARNGKPGFECEVCGDFIVSEATLLITITE